MTLLIFPPIPQPSPQMCLQPQPNAHQYFNPSSEKLESYLLATTTPLMVEYLCLREGGTLQASALGMLNDLLGRYVIPRGSSIGDSVELARVLTDLHGKQLRDILHKVLHIHIHIHILFFF